MHLNEDTEKPLSILDRTGTDPKLSTKRPFVKKVLIQAASAMKRDADILSWSY